MSRAPYDEDRENRIASEIIPDSYTPREQALGWYYYLEEHLQFPFTAKCIIERVISPLRNGKEIEIVGLAPEEECYHEIFVLTPWDRRSLGIPLSQLEGLQVDDDTSRAIEDWRYWN